LPAELDRIIGKALEKDRSLRYQNAVELHADLQRLKRDSSADRTAGARQAQIGARSGRWVWLWIAAAVLLIVAAVTIVLFLPRHADRAVRELVPTRVTSNSSDAPVQLRMALSPDGKYLAYSDDNGVHVRSMQTGDSRVLTDTKDMQVFWWAADATQFYAARRVNEQILVYDLSLAGGSPHLLGTSVPSPSGKYSVTITADPFGGFGGIRRGIDGKAFPLRRENGVAWFLAWAPNDKYVAARFTKIGSAPPWVEALDPENRRLVDAAWIEALDPENGRWRTLVGPQREYIWDAAWLSVSELIYIKSEPAPRSDANLWTVKVDPASGLPSGTPQRRTQWTDFGVVSLSANADGSRLCFLRGREESDVYVGDIQAKGRRLASLRQLTREEASSFPFAWTPDSRAVFLTSNRNGSFRIYRHDVEKDTAELITHGPGLQTRPRLSPDGRWLLYWNWLRGDRQARLMRILLAGGADEEVLNTSDPNSNISCSYTPGGGCVLVEMQGKTEIVSLVDPMKGRGPKILEITGESTGDPTMSPDGRHIAFVLGAANLGRDPMPQGRQNQVRIVDLHGAIESEITIPGAEYLVSLDWSADGTGLFSGDSTPSGTRLLHLERNGASQVLWALPAGGIIWGIPSPDGRHVATFKTRLSANVRMVENP
jgi:Tol biopolymer transport system component